MRRPPQTGRCDSCREYKPTEMVQDDWTTYLEWYELCYDCLREEEDA